MATYRGMYRPLIDHLAARTEPVVYLTYEEIEALLDARLPPEARTGASFWTRAGAAHAMAWRAHGWRAHFARRRAFIIFTRAIGTRDVEGKPCR